MASIALKSLKFTQILKGRLSFKSINRLRSAYLVRSYSNEGHRKTYTTAAHKLASNEESDMKNDVQLKSSQKNNYVIKDSLSKIDLTIRNYGRIQFKSVNKIYSLITTKEETSSAHGLYLLRSCKYCCNEPPSKRIELVNRIWNKYQELGIEFDVRHYNALLDVHVANGFGINPAEFLASMEDVNIKPNKDTYMLLMKKYCQDGNISGASEILEYMKENEIPVDEKVFNYLIEGHIKNNDITGAKEMLEVMRSSNLDPTADTHAILACGYAAAGDKPEMMAHLEKCNVQDSVQNHLKVIEVLASTGNQELINDVLSLVPHKENFVQEFINCAVELIHKDCIDVAYKLIAASSSPNYYEGANIFIKQLIRAGKEPSEVLQFCERIHDEGLSKSIHLVAAVFSIESKKLDYVSPLFKRMQEVGYFLRPSSFWSLFSPADGQPALETGEILKTMSELGVPCDFRTYVEYVYPAMGMPTPEDVLETIKMSGQTLDVALDALFAYYCNVGAIEHASQLIENFSVKVDSRFSIQDFLKVYGNISPENMPKFLKLLKFIFMEGNSLDNCDVQGRLLAELIMHRRRLLEILVNQFEELKFSDFTLKICHQELTEQNPRKLDYLNKLIMLSDERRSIFKKTNISEKDEDKYIRHLTAQNISCRSFLIKRILHHIKDKNIPRVNQLLALFEEMNLEYSPLILSSLIGLSCAAGDIEKAKDAVEKLKEFPNFKVDLSATLDYVTLLIKYEKFDESYEVLSTSMKNEHFFASRDAIKNKILKLNSTLSETQNVDFVKKMQSVILPLSKELGTKKLFLDPPVHLYLLRNDFKSAFEEFRNIVQVHHMPACLNMFLRKCINANETEMLQKVVDLTITCSGKTYALLELAVAFLETFNNQKAMKVIESLGPETDPKVLLSICESLSSRNKLSELESLIYMTKSMSHVDREKMYCFAFRLCANRNEFDRALKLFNDMKGEVIEPEPETLKLLQNLFERNNKPFPLSVLAESQSELVSEAEENTKNLIGHLEAGNVDEALTELSVLKKGYIRTLPLKSLTDLVDLCLQKDRVQELSRRVFAMSYILENEREVLKPILEKYSDAGDVENIVKIVTLIPDFALMKVGFNFYFCKAFVTSGKFETLLSHLEENVQKKNKLFSTYAFEELLKFPEYEDRVYNLALKYLESKFDAGMATVWACYFAKENYEKAEEIYKQFSFSCGKTDHIILKSIKQNDNVSLAKKYVDFLKQANVRTRTRERAYGTAIDLLVFKGQYDEAVDLVVESEKQNLLLHKYYLSTLVTLKAILEKENKPVPFSLPADVSSGSGSETE